MTKTKTMRHRQLAILFCVFLLFSTLAIPAYADKRQEVDVIYTVTEDMLPKASPTPLPTATPKPVTSDRPKTGDESNIKLYVLLGSGSLLAALGAFTFYMKRKDNDYD